MVTAKELKKLKTPAAVKEYAAKNGISVIEKPGRLILAGWEIAVSQGKTTWFQKIQ